MQAKPKRGPILGRQFATFVVIGLLPKMRCRIFCFRCKKSKTVRRGNIYSYRSCGCAHDEMVAKSRTIHGHACRGRESLTFKRFYMMHGRCENPKDSHYYKYGAKGVKVCASWSGKNGFVRFLKDMGPVPSKDYSLSRTLDLGDYRPGNVCWGTKEHQYEQARLKRALLKKKKEEKKASESLPLAA